MNFMAYQYLCKFHEHFNRQSTRNKSPKIKTRPEQSSSRASTKGNPLRGVSVSLVVNRFVMLFEKHITDMNENGFDSNKKL